MFAPAPAAAAEAAPAKRTLETAYRSPPPRAGWPRQGYCKDGRESRYKPDSLNPTSERLLLSEGLIHPSSANHDNAKTNKTESLLQPAAVGAAAPCSCGQRKPGRGRDEVGNLLCVGGCCGEPRRIRRTVTGLTRAAPRLLLAGRQERFTRTRTAPGAAFVVTLDTSQNTRLNHVCFVLLGDFGELPFFFFFFRFTSHVSGLRFATGKGGKGLGPACPGQSRARGRGRGSCPAGADPGCTATPRRDRARRGQGRSAPPGRRRPRARRRPGGSVTAQAHLRRGLSLSGGWQRARGEKSKRPDNASAFPTATAAAAVEGLRAPAPRVFLPARRFSLQKPRRGSAAGLPRPAAQGRSLPGGGRAREKASPAAHLPRGTCPALLSALSSRRPLA